MSKEQDYQQPSALPKELREFLQTVDYAWVMDQTNLGTLFIFKAANREIIRLRGIVPVQFSHELYNTELAPVIRSVVRWYDRIDSPLVFETFTNVRSRRQRDDFAGLTAQKAYLCAFYNESLERRLAKRVPNTQQRAIRAITQRAIELAQTIPDERYDFDQAKDTVIRQTML